MAVQLDAVFASLCRAAIPTSSRVGTKTFDELWNRRVDPAVAQLLPSRDLVHNVDVRLTDFEIPLERQPERLRTPPQDLCGDTRFRAPRNPFPPAALLKAAGPASLAYHAMGSGVIPEVPVQPLSYPRNLLPHHGQRLHTVRRNPHHHFAAPPV